ncbi:hypothetical protein ACLKA7_016846 [Drosophila subpalustris]
MKFLIVFVALFAIALAGEAEILKQDSDVRPDGYDFAVETSDGTSRKEDGVLKNVGTDHEAIAVHGEVSWVDNEGHPHNLKYVADETGYHPESSDIPVSA